MFTAASTGIDSRLSAPLSIEDTMVHEQDPDGFGLSPAMSAPHRRQKSPRSIQRLQAPSRSSSLLIALVLSCPLMAVAMPYASHHSFPPSAGSSGGSAVGSSTKSLGVYMIRSPESTTAPAGDEVLFECELNLIPERLEWRFRAQGNQNGRDDYVFLSKNVSSAVCCVGLN